MGKGNISTHIDWETVFNFSKETLRILIKKIRLKITQLEKVHFIKENELKLTQVELFSFFHFKCVDANASELFCIAHLAYIERFLYHSNLSF